MKHYDTKIMKKIKNLIAPMKSERVTRVSGEQAIALETHKHLQFSPNTMWCWFLRAGIGGTYVEDAENQVSTRWTTRIWITRRTAT
jgi:hypothetical protein